MSSSEKKDPGVFGLGAPNDAYKDYFVGQSYLKRLLKEPISIANVTFEPGCRNNWHIHHNGGQILLVTGGKGWFQEWGQQPRELNPGDVVNIAPEIKHWHGAAKNSWFSHLSIEVPAEGSSNEWLEPVADEEYKKLFFEEAIEMDRPYIICHMSTSLDGKITGSYMLTPEAESAFVEYERINQFYQPQAWINGRVTIEESFTFYEKPELQENVPLIPHDDYAVIGDFENYIAAADPSGRLGWKQNYVEYAGRPKAHVIEILTEQVSDAYLAFLQEKKISYIFAGTDTIDFTVAVKKLKRLFGIEKLKLSGGGILNWSFAQAGLIDELSLIIAPIADGETDTPTLFERSEKLPPHIPVGFDLKSVEAAKDGCVWLRYVAKKMN